MFRSILVLILIAFPILPVFARNAPDYIALRKNWGRIDSLAITKAAGEKYTAALKAGGVAVSRDLYMISPENPEMLLWIFHGYKPSGDPYKQSPEIIIQNLGLKELSSWHNSLIVIVDSGTSLYSYNPDEGMSEIRIYTAIYDRFSKQYGVLPAILAGISSGAEGAVKFAPFVKKLNSLICISGTYDFGALPADSGEYKIHLKEYGAPSGWRYEEPVRILPALQCKIFLLSEENSIYRAQASEAARLLSIPGKNKIEFVEDIGKGRSHDWDFWGSQEVKKILQREVQAAGEN